MKNIIEKKFLTNLESNKIYYDCSFDLAEKMFFFVRNSQFYNCNFNNGGLFTSLKNCSFEECNFIGYFELNLESQKLTKLPLETFGFNFLTHLVIGAGLYEFPPQIGNLQNLIGLKISCSKIQYLPKEISKLKLLKHFYFVSNSLKKFPEEIGELTQLHTLSLHIFPLRTLPPQIGYFTNLKSLCFMEMEIRDFPAEMINLRSLKYVCGYINTEDKNFLEAILPNCQVDAF